MTEPNAQELKFEEALARLEEIVRLLEQGESTLDESLTLFEEGSSWPASAAISWMRRKVKSRS